MARSLICTIFLILLAAPRPARALEIGVNGHPFAQVVYKEVSIQEQLDLVKELGGKWYRVDCYGDMIQPPRLARLRELVTEARKRGITVLPVIFPDVDVRKEDDLKTLYKRSYDYAIKLVSQFGNEIPAWELHNELDAFSIVKKGELSYYGRLWKFDIPSGDKPEHYEARRIEKAMAVLKGLSEGVHAAAPAAQRIINGSWKHVGFLEHVQQSGIGFEIIGWHWYSEMGDMSRVKGDYRLLEKLRAIKPRIWVTEMDRRGGSRGDLGELEQARYLRETLRQFARDPGNYPVEKAIVYELLDEPHFGASPEASYGLVQVVKGPDGRWRTGVRKQAFRAVAGFSEP